MKTIDEVIKAMEYCQTPDQMGNCNVNCPYIHCCDPESVAIKTDALQYLKEYRTVTDICHKHGIASVWGQVLPDPEKTDWDKKLNFDNAYDNDPLDWETLKTMEGKPVWVEYNFQIGNKEFRDNSKRWCIIREFKPWYDTEIIITGNGIVLSKNEQVKGWQAYRKERS